VILQGAESQHG